MNALKDHLGVHTAALTLREARGGMLAANIAHAATPGYKARDMDFGAALASEMGAGPLRTSHAQHIAVGDPVATGLGYRQPTTASLDGNTVELDVEQREFAENALRYQLSLTLLNRKISGLARAIKGE